MSKLPDVAANILVNVHHLLEDEKLELETSEL